MLTEKMNPDSLEKVKVYNGPPGTQVSPKECSTEVIVEQKDVILSMYDHYNPNLHCAVLNHMCYKEPAPYYLSGAAGREESLCRHSNLYSILIECKDFYSYNKKHKNRGMCENRALYIPKLIFNTKKEDVIYSVIGAQAPDWKHCGLQYHMFTEEENNTALRDRIRLIFGVAINNKVDILVLGAFGCSVYGQKPDVVASIFKECLQGDYSGYFKKIIFPIDTQEAFEKFNKTFILS